MAQSGLQPDAHCCSDASRVLHLGLVCLFVCSRLPSWASSKDNVTRRDETSVSVSDFSDTVCGVFHHLRNIDNEQAKKLFTRGNSHLRAATESPGLRHAHVACLPFCDRLLHADSERFSFMQIIPKKYRFCPSSILVINNSTLESFNKKLPSKTEFMMMMMLRKWRDHSHH